MLETMKIETNSKTKENNPTRQHILDCGYQLIAREGFSNVGLSQILKHAEVPKGSFYHYFKSKELFGEALIQDYFLHYQNELETHFNAPNSNHYDKLIAYWQRWIDAQNTQGVVHTCLVVKLSAEVSDLSESMRLALLTGAQKIIAILSLCIEAGIKEGTIQVKNPHNTAQLLYNLWIGSSLLSKLSQNSQNLEQTMHISKAILANKAHF